MPSSRFGKPTQYIFACLAYCLILALPAQALTIYRLGGADAPRPQLEVPYDFVQLSWDQVGEDAHGRADLIELGDHIAPKTLDPTVNLAPQIEELGGRILILEWNGWQKWRDDDIYIFDGDPETAYLGDGHYLRVAGYGPQQKYWVFDFGGRFFIDRIRFYPRDDFLDTRFIEHFLIGISDGDPLKDGSREYTASWRNNSLDFDLVYQISENTQPVMELPMPPQPVQQLLIELPENTRGIWEIAEFEIYGTGPASRAVYLSNIIDLGAAAALGPLTWSGQQGEQTRIDLTARAGSDDDPNTYWRTTFRGDERTRFDEAGKQLTLSTYERLGKGQQAGITPDTENWDFWSIPFDFDAGQAPLPSDRPRRYLQLKADFQSTAQGEGQLNYLQFAASQPPVASRVLAEVSPFQAPARTPIPFTYTLEPHLESGDLGFDRLAIDTPTEVLSIDAVRLGGVAVDIDITQRVPTGFELALPRIDQTRTQELIEVEFTAEVFAFSTQFSGRVRDSTKPHEIPQSITAGDADPRNDATGLQVNLAGLEQSTIGALTLRPELFTPNSDGINDAVQIEYDLLYLVDAVQIELLVYDLSGRQVGQIDTDQAASGRFATTWDGRDPSGALLPPGIYLMRLRVETDQGKKYQQRLVSLAY
ncbi:MAG: hypothetical protein GKR89_22240 [Candidatus Latescibacteria bacterium]|nr:hypothetical protein [Candidatus Latescibacterota bacterium]